MNAPQRKLEYSIAPLVSLLLFVAVFSGFQGGRYFMSNRLQEIGIMASLLLFGLGAWLAVFRVDHALWKRWVYTPFFLVAAIMGVWSAVFALRFGESFIYCLFASREFLLAFIAPAMFLIVAGGYPRKTLEKVIWSALVALMLNYLAFYFSMDLREAFFSNDHTISNLVTYDEWRGFRLKPPLFAIMLGLLASAVVMFQFRGVRITAAAAAIVGLSLYIWSIVMFRSTLATMLLAVCLYPLLMSTRNRVGLLLLCAVLLIAVAPMLSGWLLEYFARADGGGIRLKAFAIALEHIPEYFLLGAGEDNAFGRTYQDIFGFYFYPSDLGFIGIVFKYGIVGACLYVFMHVGIWLNLLRSNWAYRSANTGRLHPLLWALLIFFTAQTFNLVLNPGLAYAQGITAGAIAIALSGILKREAYAE